MKRAIFIAFLLLIAGNCFARRISGTVSHEKTGLQGVIVSDGYNFCTSGKNGKYSLELCDSARFVFVISPSGYTVDCSQGTPLFYKSIGREQRYDFNLLKTAQGDDYTLFSISDPQCKTVKQFKKFCGAPLRDIGQTAEKYKSEGVVAGILLGDIGWDSGKDINHLYKERIGEAGIPIYPVIGNHDFDLNRKGLEAQLMYERDFGPVNYAFFLGGDLVIAVKNIIYDTQKKYREGYTDTELNWIKGLLELVPETTHIYVAQHSPTSLWYRKNKSIHRGDEFIALFGERKVDILSGHTHIQNHFYHNANVMEHNSAAICGSWWSTIHCTDGTPRGYEVFRSRGGHIDWYYHCIDFPDSHRVEVIYPGHSLMNNSKLVLKVWDSDPLWKVELYGEDDRFIGQMEPVLDVSPSYVEEITKAYPRTIPKFKRPSPNTHYYALEVPGGIKTVKARIISPYGYEWTEEITL